MRREEQHNQLVNYLVKKIYRKVRFSEKNQIRYYHLSEDERNMKRSYSHYISYMIRQKIKMGF